MRVLIVLAHPEVKSFNGALYLTAVEALKKSGHEIKTTNLYEMNFNPSSDRHNFTTVRDASFLKLGLEEIYATEHNGFASEIQIEQEKVEWCDLMIWQFPLWWFSVPGILKGWTDRIFAAGKMYGGGRVPFVSGKFIGKKALLSITTGSPEGHYLKDGPYGDINGILKPIHRGIFEYTGFSVLRAQLNYAVAHITEEERKILINQWSDRLKGIFQEDAITIGKY